jgi:hypothetical protein
MPLNKSIVEDAALESFGELCYAVGYGPHPTPFETAAQRDSLGKMVLLGCLRKGSRWRNRLILVHSVIFLLNTLPRELLNWELLLHPSSPKGPDR